MYTLEQRNCLNLIKIMTAIEIMIPTLETNLI